MDYEAEKFIESLETLLRVRSEIEAGGWREHFWWREHLPHDRAQSLTAAEDSFENSAKAYFTAVAKELWPDEVEDSPPAKAPGRKRIPVDKTTH